MVCIKSNLSLLFLVIAFSLHNVEEVVRDLPAWMAVHFNEAVRIESSTFETAIILVSLLSWAIYAFCRFLPQHPLSTWLTAIMSASFLANSFSHVGLSVAKLSLMPGLYSAILVLGPISAVSLFNTARRLRLGYIGLTLLFLGGAAIQWVVPLLVLRFSSVVVS